MEVACCSFCPCRIPQSSDRAPEPGRAWERRIVIWVSQPAYGCETPSSEVAGPEGVVQMHAEVPALTGVEAGSSDVEGAHGRRQVSALGADIRDATGRSCWVTPAPPSGSTAASRAACCHPADDTWACCAPLSKVEMMCWLSIRPGPRRYQSPGTTAGIWNVPAGGFVESTRLVEAVLAHSAIPARIEGLTVVDAVSCANDGLVVDGVGKANAWSPSGLERHFRISRCRSSPLPTCFPQRRDDREGLAGNRADAPGFGPFGSMNEGCCTSP